MSSILNNFEICAKIPQNIRINIKSLYVFKDCFLTENIIFVTKEDKVYALGHNYCGTLGFGHNSRVKKCTQIKELSHQKINNIFNGWTHVLGLNYQNQLFSWGWNVWGQLGRGHKSKVNQCLKPKIIEFFEHKNIEHICCGYYHSLVLLSNGSLYCWGRNSEGQLGLHNGKTVDIPTKFEINGKKDLRFKYIHCSHFSSFAITTNGLLFSWGYNGNGVLGQGFIGENCIPRQIELFNVCSISSIECNTYFLTNEGLIYFCGKYDLENRVCIRKTPKKISDQGHLIHDLPIICGNNKEVYCSNFESIFYRLYQNRLNKVNKSHESSLDLFAKLIGITPKMVHISLGKSECDGHLNKNLQKMSVIGSGGFGTVTKYFDVLEKQLFAMKRINIRNSLNMSDKNVVNEVLTMAKLKSHFVVDFYDSWVENNQLFIQMEYCFHNLKEILGIKPLVFERNENQAINSIEYLISLEIFRQITEALNYLHSLKPEPLIHRDLKPENILIGNYENKKICKLADFGLSKFIGNHSDYHTMIGATHKYRAPEIASGHKYDTTVDIWSLGMIALEIFNLDNSNESNHSKSFSLSQIFYESLSRKLKKCDQIITNKLLTPKRHQRISCRDLLVQIDTCTLSRNSLEMNMLKYKEIFANFNVSFFCDILKLNI